MSFIRYLFLFLGLFVSQYVFSEVSENKEEKPFVVVIDPGHGGRDSGAIGRTLKLKEKDLVLNMSLALGNLIKANYPDVKVIYTRSTDVFIPLDQRARIANKASADLFISVHINAVKSRTPHGLETYVFGLSRSDENLEVVQRENSVILLEDNYEQTYKGFDPNSSESYIMFQLIQNEYLDQSIAFATSIQSEFSKSVKLLNRGVKQNVFLVLRETAMPSVLVEMGFISNESDERFLNTKEGKNKLVQALFRAFGNYKKEHDRKRKIAASVSSREGEGSVSTSTVVAAVPETTTADTIVENTGIVYKVQILASTVKLRENSRELKGYKGVSFYQEKGMYKYTYGESFDWNEIQSIQRRISKDFKGAFVVKFRNGVKIE